MPVTEFNKRVQRHITVLQSQIGRLSPLIYYHPTRPRVVSCECYKLRSFARFRHEFVAIVFEHSGKRYRVQFDRGWGKPGRVASLQWLSGKPHNNRATISFSTDPMNLDEMDVIGRIVYQAGRLPLLTRTLKHVTEVFGDAPVYFLFTWNCWLFARVAFMRAVDLSPSEVAVWRGQQLNGQNLLHQLFIRERSVAPWASRICEHAFIHYLRYGKRLSNTYPHRACSALAPAHWTCSGC